MHNCDLKSLGVARPINTFFLCTNEGLHGVKFSADVIVCKEVSPTFTPVVIHGALSCGTKIIKDFIKPENFFELIVDPPITTH